MFTEKRHIIDFFSFFLLHIWISLAHSLWLSATGYDWSLDNSSLCDKLFKVRPGAVSVPGISGFYIFSSLILNLNDNKCNLTPDGTEHFFLYQIGVFANIALVRISNPKQSQTISNLQKSFMLNPHVLPKRKMSHQPPWKWWIVPTEGWHCLARKQCCGLLDTYFPTFVPSSSGSELVLANALYVYIMLAGGFKLGFYCFVLIAHLLIAFSKQYILCSSSNFSVTGPRPKKWVIPLFFPPLSLFFF